MALKWVVAILHYLIWDVWLYLLLVSPGSINHIQVQVILTARSDLHITFRSKMLQRSHVFTLLTILRVSLDLQ